MAHSSATVSRAPASGALSTGALSTGATATAGGPGILPVNSRPTPSVPALFAAARAGLADAAAAQVSRERYALAHLAALRAAAAVLAARARPAQTRRRPVSAWKVLASVAPELGEWAEFFAVGATKRAAAEAGRPVASRREADDLMRDAARFLAAAEAYLGLAHQPVLSAS
ncbi:MAG TPA: SAV_6107 family HEPN domain-containing protein [Frankiaceae bacterium]|nr:SAV_6107 family HEPN domain-containing protein [Frankiaceae bacterium]